MKEIAMTSARHLSRRGFLGSAAAALSFVYLPGVGRVKAQPYTLETAADFQGRLCYNENPLGPSPHSLDAMREASALTHRYPDWYNGHLESRIASHHGLDAENICAGAGATEVIRLIADAFLGPGEEVITATPSYLQIASEAVANAASVVHVPLDENYAIDLESILMAVGPSTRMVSLVNPNNPVATIFGREEMDAFLRALPGGILVMVDEAYHDYAGSPHYESCIRHVQEGEPVIVVRTFSKVYGLAGARIGYAVASPSLIGAIGSSQQFGMISRSSQAAAEAALDDRSHIDATLFLNDRAKRMLETGFTRLGLDFIHSETNFMMFDTGTDAGGVISRLSSRGYQVRTGWGMPRHIRISTGSLEDTQGFLEALAEILGTTEVQDHPVVLPDLALHPAYPNPFSSACQIRVSIPGNEPVSLVVYDIEGRKIRALATGILEPGVHKIAWDGRDYAGKPVASGTYILNLVQGELATSGRVTLVK